MKRLHVIGAGLAGLAAAVKAASQGLKVSLYEGASAAGGRARSFFDETLQCRIDNGNHLVLSGNHSVGQYLDLIGARDAFHVPPRAVFPFIDLASGERWAVQPGKGRSPLWIFKRGRGVPGTALRDIWDALKVRYFSRGKRLQECVRRERPLYSRFWEPLTLAALNTPADLASAWLLGAVLRESFFLGEAACRPMVAKEGLSESLVDPALAYLKTKDAAVAFQTRLTAMENDGGRVTALVFGNRRVPLEAGEAVVLALPPWQVKEILPIVSVPETFHAIVNVHFKVKTPRAFAETPFVGILNGTAQWVFVRENIASVTVSAADALAEESADAIAGKTWPEAAQALGLTGPMPPLRVIKEKRATFSQTPEALR
ncbi:MAG TPA: hydroxysqualene dehydroxylase HpnE, partial [Sphingomonadales bacterium]|nr:hydroxysqualene dehydroxylase HpnE [Sphingomonadales bacterium]